MRATAELVVAAGERNIRVVVTTAPDLRVVRKVPCPAQPVLADFIDAVAQVVTFGMPHDKLGEELGAAIVLREGQDLGEHKSPAWRFR